MSEVSESGESHAAPEAVPTVNEAVVEDPRAREDGEAPAVEDVPARADTTPPDIAGAALPIPPAALLALGAAVAIQFGGRFVLRMLNHEHLDVSRELLGNLARGATFLQNLTVTAGIVAVGIGLTQSIHPRSRAHPSLGHPQLVLIYRTGVAVLSGIFLPMMLVALLLPATRNTGTIIRFGVGAGSVLVAFLAALTARPPAPVPFRLAFRALVVAGLFGFAYGILAVIGEVRSSASFFESAVAARRTGELAYLVALASLAFGVVPRGRWDLPVLGAMVVSAIVSAVPLTLMRTYGRMTSPSDLADLLYGATHFELFLGSAPMAYGVLIGLFGGVGILGLAGTPVQRRGALALLALLASGYAPTTAPTLIVTVLGYVLLTRAQPRLGDAPARAAEPPLS